jgi:hypothetical protein
LDAWTKKQSVYEWSFLGPPSQHCNTCVEADMAVERKAIMVVHRSHFFEEAEMEMGDRESLSEAE